MPICPATELTLRMWPWPCRRMAGSTARHTRIVPKKFVSNCSRASAIDVDSTAPARPNPALFTTASIRPSDSRTRLTAFSTDSSDVMSSGMVWNNGTASGGVDRGST